MKIQVGNVFLNKTVKYLVPLLKLYGDVLKANVNSLQILAVGIGDFLLDKQLENHLFILTNSKYPDPNTFAQLIKWLRVQDYFEDDYAYDDVITGNKHMIILKLPKDKEVIEEFKKGNYSKLYSYEEAYKLVKDDGVFSVLIKDHNYVTQFVKNINNEFGTNLKEEEVGDRELDRFPFDKEEIFNYDT